MEQFVFKPRAQLLLQLGEQLIKSEDVAVLEIVKNSYDADAKKVTVKIIIHDDHKTKNNESEDVKQDSNYKSLDDYIEIKDNGFGMSKDDILNIWLEPGNTHKKHLVDNNIRTPLGRLPIGEKGIGRFGVHKLGKKITLISKKQGCKEVVLNIDWTKYETAEYLSDVNIEILEREPELFIDKGEIKATGTYIYISNLSSKWDKTKIRNLKKAVDSLNSPFESNDQFKVKFKTNKIEWIEDIKDFSTVKDDALYSGEIELSGDSITSYSYKFSPYSIMSSIESREVYSDKKEKMNITFNEELKDCLDNNEENMLTINLDRYKIGKIKVVIYYYDRDSKKRNFFNLSSDATSYLNANCGVRVFRDNLRVMDYGEPGTDWLELDKKRINNPSKKISNRNILAAVYLDREFSKDLIEKANREGFIENDAFLCFKAAVSYAIELFTSLRNSDKHELNKALTEENNSIENKITSVSDSINNLNIEVPQKKKLDEKLKGALEDIHELKNFYLKTSSLGMSYGIIIHDIEKAINELNSIVKNEEVPETITTLAERLDLLIKNYSSIMRSRRSKDTNLSDILNQSIKMMQTQLEDYNIHTETEPVSIDCTADVQYNLIVSALINIIDNSIYWLRAYEIKNKKIYFKISDEVEGYISIIVADNGLGYNIAPEDAIKPFVSKKYDGMGLGLTIVNEIMVSQNGIVTMPENRKDGVIVNGFEINIPLEFRTGAITVLSFKKEIM